MRKLYSDSAYIRIEKGQEITPILFGYIVKEKDLYYMGEREYNPINGTFHSKNLYRYMGKDNLASMNTKDNPLDYLDFDGCENI